jgi:gas vesicle protein
MANNKGSSLGIGLILGTLIGAAMGLILAPQAGEKTRVLLKTKADEWSAKADEWSAKAKDSYREALKEGKEVAAKAHEELRARFEKAKGCCESDLRSEKAEEPD